MINVVIALVVAFGSLIIGFLGEGGHVGALIGWTPALIVFGGTLGSVMLSFPMPHLKGMIGALKAGMNYQPQDLNQLIVYFHDLSQKSKREGLLSLESEIAAHPEIDPFIHRGIQSVVDGEDLGKLRDALENEIGKIEERHKIAMDLFNVAGGTAPTMGICGTVLGLVHVLEGLATADISMLGESIASAFLATLYGLASANLLFLPIAKRLKLNSEMEIMEKELMVEGICLIQQGTAPKMLQEKLTGLVSKKTAEAAGLEPGGETAAMAG